MSREIPKDYYENIAELFHQEYFQNIKLENSAHVVRKNWIQEQLRTVGRVDIFLDIGSAEGLYLLNNEDMMDFGIGLDISVSFIKKAKDTCREIWHKVDFVNGDAQNLPFRSGVMDVLLCTEVLEHLPNYQEAIVEMAKVCSGSLIITVPNEKVDYLKIAMGKVLSSSTKNKMEEGFYSSDSEKYLRYKSIGRAHTRGKRIHYQQLAPNLLNPIMHNMKFSTKKVCHIASCLAFPFSGHDIYHWKLLMRSFPMFTFKIMKFLIRLDPKVNTFPLLRFNAAFHGLVYTLEERSDRIET